MMLMASQPARDVADDIQDDIGAAMSLVEHLNLDEGERELEEIARLARELRNALERYSLSGGGSISSS